MQQLFKVVERLHHLELYDDLCLFCELHLPGEPTKTFIDCEDELDLDQCGYLLCCMANACAQLNNFPQAIRNYEMAHLYLSNIRQRKLKNRYEHELNGAEIRFRMHKILLESKQEEEALRCLESVPRTELTPKILLSMARLCHQLGKMPSQSTRSLFNRRVDAPNTRIVNYFKAIIKDVPEAVYCRSYLLSVGAIKSPVLSPSAEHSNNKTAQQNAAATGTTTEDPLLPAELANGLSCAETRVWAEAKQQQAKKCFLEAAKLLETAAVAPNLRFLLEQARFYRIAGDHHKALACYQQAHLFDSTNAEGMDALAALLGTSNSQQAQRELDLLAHKMLHSNPNRPEAFVVYGWAVRQCHRVTEAKQLAQKAEQLAQRRGRQRCEALLLKAQLLFDTKRHYKEMEMVLADALHNDCTNTAVYALYIQMFIAQKRCAEAQRMAKTSMKFVGEHNHQIRFLFAQALAEDPNAGGQSGTDQAIAVLEKMVKDGQLISLEPLLLLARLYDRQQKYEKAIELLSRFKESFADPRIHRELGDLLSKTNRPNEALGEYGQAMSASATDSSTKERMINLMGGFTTPQCAVNAVFESGSGAGGGTTTTATTTNMGNAGGGGSTGPNEARGIRMPPPVARVTRRMAVNQHEQLRRLRGMGGINRPSSAISGGGTASAGSSSGGRGGSRAAQIHRIANAPAGNRMAVTSGLSPVLAPLRFDDDQQQQADNNDSGSRMDAIDADDSEDSNNSQLSLDGPREEEEEDDDDDEEEEAEEDANTTNGSSSTAEQPRAGGGSGGHAAMVHRMVSDIQRYMVRNVSTTTTAPPAASASNSSATTTTTAATSSASATTYEPTSASSNSTMMATTTTGTTTIQQQGSSIDSSGGTDADFVPLIADEPLVEGGGTGEGSMVDEGEDDEEEEDGRMSIDNGGGDIGGEEVLALSEDEDDDDQMNLT